MQQKCKNSAVVLKKHLSNSCSDGLTFALRSNLQDMAKGLSRLNFKDLKQLLNKAYRVDFVFNATATIAMATELQLEC